MISRSDQTSSIRLPQSSPGYQIFTECSLTWQAKLRSHNPLARSLWGLFRQVEENFSNTVTVHEHLVKVGYHTLSELLK